VFDFCGSLLQAAKTAREATKIPGLINIAKIGGSRLSKNERSAGSGKKWRGNTQGNVNISRSHARLACPVRFGTSFGHSSNENTAHENIPGFYCPGGS
jgi:hypothetical protein